MDSEMQERYLQLIMDIKNYFLKYGKNDPEKKLSSNTHKIAANNIAKEVYDKAVLIEPEISSVLVGLVEPSLSELKSFEHRIKDYDSLKRKIISDSKKFDGSYRRAADKIFDAVRYTIVIPDDLFVIKAEEYLRKLESNGYYVVELKNKWGTDSCQGYNVKLRAKGNGEIFEIQFHTPFGYHIKEGFTRELYEIARDERVDAEIIDLKKRANEFRSFFFKLIPIPKDAIGYKYERSMEDEYGKRR